MNDRLKFRVWSKKYNMYLKDRTYPVGGSHFYISQDGGIFEDSGPVDEWDENPPNRFDNPDYIIEQCTGLKDRNGNLIFEGDVVDYYSPMADEHYQGVVTFDDDEHTASGYYIKGGRVGKFDSYLDGSYCRIIGNIHEGEE